MGGLASRAELTSRGECAPTIRIFNWKEVYFREFLTEGDTDTVDWNTPYIRIVYCLTKEEAKPDDGDGSIAVALRERFGPYQLMAPDHVDM